MVLQGGAVRYNRMIKCSVLAAMSSWQQAFAQALWKDRDKKPDPFGGRSSWGERGGAEHYTTSG